MAINYDTEYPKLQADNTRLRAENDHKTRQLDHLLQHCGDAECDKCAEIICPEHEPLHFHHDGCPACHSYARLRKQNEALGELVEAIEQEAYIQIPSQEDARTIHDLANQARALLESDQ